MENIKVYHKLEMIDNVKQFVVYADYPFEYEFGIEGFRSNVSKVSSKIKEYISKNLNAFKDATVMLVLNGVIIGIFSIYQIIGPNVEKLEANQKNNFQSSIESNITSKSIENNTPNSDLNILSSALEEEQVAQEKKDEELVIPEQKVNVTEIKSTKSTPSITYSKSNSITTKKASTTTNTKSTSSATSSTPSSTNNTYTNVGKTVKLRLNSGNVIDIPLEDYVIGVVSSEMPVLFNSEALKAQSVAARTYALKKVESGGILSTTVADQVYRTNDELKSSWGSLYDSYYNKVKTAVLATSSQVMTYNGEYIDALYFSTSNGRTEDPIYVWKYTEPYLKSVDCKWDTGVSNFSATKTMSMSEISQKLGVNLTDISQIKINSLTTGNRVNSITIAGKNFTGVQIRTALGLRSTDFSMLQSGNNIIFTTKGYGHGVGMSQYGANEMAKAGYSYSQILKYFYTGVTIEKK